MTLIEQIAYYSPWWYADDWYQRDKHLQVVSESGIAFRHFDEKISFKKGSINILRGPRQIGKTTELKLFIRDLIKSGTTPSYICYYPCDNILNHRELFEIIREILAHLQAAHSKLGFIFLDEISSVKNWQRPIKNLSDAGALSNVFLLLTGSSAVEIKRGYERMPGRRAGGFDMVLLPMDFFAFCKCFNIPESSQYSLPKVIDSPEAFQSFRLDVSRNETKYIKMLEIFMLNGGFPKVVSDFVRLGRLDDETLEISKSVMFSEFEKQRRQVSTLKSILRKLYLGVATPLSYNNIAADSDVYSAKGAKEYIDILHSSFLSFSIGCLDMTKKRSFPKKDKKFYFTDSVELRVISEMFQLPMLEESKMAEHIVASNLIRIFRKEWASYGFIDQLFYWKSSKGKEIDFVFFHRGKPFGIEVKYQNVVSGWDEISIKRGIGKGLLVTRKTFEYGEVPKIPLWAFLLLKYD
jgi:predicted AAA+ superfamily ATPase